MPATIAASAWGSRMFQTIRSTRGEVLGRDRGEVQERGDPVGGAVNDREEYVVEGDAGRTDRYGHDQEEEEEDDPPEYPEILIPHVPQVFLGDYPVCKVHLFTLLSLFYSIISYSGIFANPRLPYWLFNSAKTGFPTKKVKISSAFFAGSISANLSG